MVNIFGERCVAAFSCTCCNSLYITEFLYRFTVCVRRRCILYKGSPKLLTALLHCLRYDDISQEFYSYFCSSTCILLTVGNVL